MEHYPPFVRRTPRITHATRDIRQESVEIVIDVALDLDQVTLVRRERLDLLVAHVEVVAAPNRVARHRIFGVTVGIHRHGHAVDTLSDGRRDVLEMMVRRLIGGIEHGVQPARIVFHPARDLLVALVEIARLRRLVRRSEEHTSELQSLMRLSYAVFGWKTKTY